MRFPAGGHGGRQQLAEPTLHGLVLVLHVEKELKAIAHPHALAKVGFVGVDFEDLQDDVGGHALPLGGVVQTRVEAGSPRLIIIDDGGSDHAFIDRRSAGHELAGGVAGDGDFVIVALAKNAETHRLDPIGPSAPRAPT